MMLPGTGTCAEVGVDEEDPDRNEWWNEPLWRLDGRMWFGPGNCGWAWDQ